MKIEGTIPLDVPADVAWRFLETPDRPLEGRASGTQKVGGDSWQSTIGLPLSFGAIRYRFRWQAVERSARQLRLRAHGEADQNVIDLDARLVLREEDGRSRLEWTADVTTGGVVASVAQRSLRAVLEHELKELLEGVAPRTR